jgi:L-iditol 2-dehydrogenase
MRVAVYYNNRDVRIEERPVPQIGPGEMLVRVERSGICGSDVMEWYRRPRAPAVLGHEIAGRVAACGKDLRRHREGDRITAAHHVPCNSCQLCRNGHHTLCETLHRANFDPGGFAEYIRLTPLHVDRGVFPLPDTLPDEEAVFVEPLACVVRGQRRAGLREAQSVLVVGSGMAGILHVKLAKSAGAAPVVAVDTHPYRLEAARRAGADGVLPAGGDWVDRFHETTGGRLADVVIVCTGSEGALTRALRMVAPGGTVLFFAPAAPAYALPLQFNETLWRTDLTLTTSYGASPSDYAEALALLGARQVHVADMISHRLALSDVALGFRLVTEAGASLKIVLDHSG